MTEKAMVQAWLAAEAKEIDNLPDFPKKFSDGCLFR